MNVPDTAQIAANMVSLHLEESPNLAGAEEGEQHDADAADNYNGEYTSSRDDGTSEAATGDKRKRGKEAGEPGDGIKRQMIALPFRGRAAIAPPSYQEQQILISSEEQTSDPEPEMQLDATEGQKFLGSLFSLVSMIRILRQKDELYEDSRGKYRRRCHMVESFQRELEELEKKKRTTTVDAKLLNDIVEARNQVSKFTIGREVLKEETSKLRGEYDALHDEVDASVETVLAYDESVKDDEALRFLPATFWTVFRERKEAANAAAESTTAKRKKIEDERAATRSRMGDQFKQDLILAKSGTVKALHSATASTEEDVQRLSTLLHQQWDLEDKEKEEIAVLRSQSGKLVKIAEKAFVKEGLLKKDGDLRF